MPKSNFFGLLSLLPLLVSAANDWSIPCLDGSCSWDVPSGENTMAGTMTITGSTNAISDITTAAGWEILNCTTDADAQDIRIVCSGDEESCSHLFQNGAEHTLVRLPQNCGPSPFARVVSCGEAEDQSLPEHLNARLRRRDGSTPTVHAVSFDTNFDQVPSSQHGNVSLLVFGSTIPGFNGNATITPAGSKRRSRIVNKRGIIDSLFGDFNQTKSTDLPPINIDQKFNIFNKTLSCSAQEQAKLSVDVDAKVNAQVTIGAVLAGSIIPPKVKEFGLFSDVSADLDGGLTIDANIAGEVDTGKIPLFTVGLPGLDIPKILSLGPTFNIDAEAKATIDLDVAMSVDLAYGVSDLQLFFPPSDGKTSSAVVAPKDTPLKLSASPNIQSNATLEVHLIPSLNFGLSAFSTVEATVFLDVDTFAALDLGLAAGATASVDSTGATGASAQVGGCVDVNGGVSVNAGAEGSFFSLFDDSTQITLFSKDFDFFKKCFEESTSTSNSSTNSTTSTSSTVSASASYVNASSTASLSVSESASAYVSVSSTASANASFTPSTSLSASSSLATSDLVSASGADSTVADGSTTTLSASSTAETSTIDSSTVADDSTTVLSSSTTSKAAMATSTSSKGSKGQNHSRARRAHAPAHVKLARRDFQCLAADITAATSLVDQTLSSSKFTS
ncbi:uncharacterized protein FOMMEDRAFT_20739 [Fomitiporia mediterranea MF3/22]|uniref:uncharacterized protein n=1 Tax=Fomitiporia mediterranea (strain MF3/22) TaxID=694068 RepID=UPI0004409A22|nr:uncharacterized protein FOMMEDRAFT_20739 [Fomitiporia mediterranea MF3/22]EJD01947.1 hypothetical protein FOMMEDRAFT_20739 [Fomitiporia mediterranea MF3/22]